MPSIRKSNRRWFIHQRYISVAGFIVIIVYVCISLLIANNSIYHVLDESSTRIIPRNVNLKMSDHVSKYRHRFSSGKTDINATVIAFLTGHSLFTYKRFVGSLRDTGYSGNIIIGLQDYAPSDVLHYLSSQGCVIKYESLVKCMDKRDSTTCVDPYPTWKKSWVRFLLIRDWLQSCNECLGPVLYIDGVNTRFQTNPFVSFTHHLRVGLHFFETDPKLMTHDHNVIQTLWECRSFSWGVPLLTERIILGDRKRFMEYLASLIHEMKEWSIQRGCRTMKDGDVMAIHNFLFYDGRVKAHVLRNDNAIIFTVTNTSIRDKNGFYVRNDGKIISILHDFEDIGALSSAVSNKLVSSVNHEINGDSSSND